MRRITIIAILLAVGCSTLHRSDSARLQGRWLGKEVRGKTEAVCHAVVIGDTAEFWGADTNEWYKATFTLREDTNPRQIVCMTTGSSYAPMVGKPRYGIYRFENGMVRLTINEFENPTVPSGFDAEGGRQFEFRRQ